MDFGRMQALAMQASKGEKGERNFTADRAWLVAYTRLVEAEILGEAPAFAEVSSLMGSERVAAPLSRTDIARLFRKVYGAPRMGGCEEEFAREVERATVLALQGGAHEVRPLVAADLERVRLALQTLQAWCDGQTVCPPELVGDGSALGDWCSDTLGALVMGKEIPSPRQYATRDDSAAG